MRDREGREFRGARGSTFVIAPGSVLAKRSPRWVMAAELVETNRLWARRVAAIEPAWVERLGAHLVKRSYGEPRWDERRGAAVTDGDGHALRAADRHRPHGAVRPDRSRRPRGRCSSATRSCRGSGRPHHGFVARNEAFRRAVEAMEARVRRAGLLDDDELFDFYDARVGPDVTSARRFDQWWKQPAPSPTCST